LGKSTHTAGAPADGIRVATRTDIGLQRERNEDYLDVARLPHGLLLVICDGMGGHRGGDHASRLAAETLTAVVADADPVEDPDVLLRRGVMRAARAIVQETQVHREYTGMGTTLVAALIRNGVAHIANVGDSRVYRYHGGALERITRDHSYVWELVEQGRITEEEAQTHPQRNVITRALSGDPDVEADLYEVRLEPGDALMLSTDGLHGMISPGEIAAAFAAGPDPVSICDDLIRRALAAGGHDNVSVILARADDGTPLIDAPTDPGGGRLRGGSGGASMWLLSALGVLLLTGLLSWYFWGDAVWNSSDRSPPDTVQTDSPRSIDTAVPDSMIYDVVPDERVLPGDTIGW